jgi:transcriptional regulator with XRE-family HTH domain
MVTAVRELRTALGDTQQAFAKRAGLSHRAIANYEAGRRLSTKALYRLAALAREHGRNDLANQFAAQLSSVIGMDANPTTSDEAVWVQSILTILRSGDPAVNAADLITATGSALERLVTAETDPAKRKGIETLLVRFRMCTEVTAEKELDKLARQRSAETGRSFESAYVEVLLERPDLYERLNQERADAARGTHLEQSVAVYGTEQHKKRRKS